MTPARVGVLALALVAAGVAPVRAQPTTTAAECTGEPGAPVLAQPVECAGEPAQMEARAPTTAAARPRVRHHRIAFALVLLIGIAGAAYVMANERWRRRRAVPAVPIERAPFVTGALVGLLVTVSLVWFGRPVGASGAIQQVAGWVGLRITPDNPYWGRAIPVGVTWQVWVIVGILLGGLAGALTHRRLVLRTLPELGWREAFGTSRALRWTIAFFAAALIEIASAIAGGCTSGLALSGGVTLAPSAFVFMMAMFATGLPTGWLVGRRSRP